MSIFRTGREIDELEDDLMSARKRIEDLEAALTAQKADASAGLIEAAEIAERYPDIPALVDFALQLRAVAAVRNNPEAWAKLIALRAADAQSDAHADFRGQMRATEFLGGPGGAGNGA